MHTDIPTRADLEQLLSVRDAACVSIYPHLARPAISGNPDTKTGASPAAAILRYPV